MQCLEAATLLKQGLASNSDVRMIVYDDIQYNLVHSAVWLAAISDEALFEKKKPPPAVSVLVPLCKLFAMMMMMRFSMVTAAWR